MSTKKTTIDKNFSARLRILIEEKLNFTQGDFAKKIGITAGYLSMVIRGKRGPSAEMMAGLYINYSKYLNWLLTGEQIVETAGKNIKYRKFEILNQAEEWLNEEVKKNPKKEIWFEVEFEEKFQEFKKWKEEKEESEAQEDYPPSHKVA